MKFKDLAYFLTEDDFEDLLNYDGERCGLLKYCKVGNLGMSVGDTIEMTYDFGCCQIFDIELLEMSDMPKGHGRAYPKILDGAGSGIIDDMPAFELLEVIKKIDKTGHSEIYYSSFDFDNATEWDYREYSVDWNNVIVKKMIGKIRDGYENYEE